MDSLQGFFSDLNDSLDHFGADIEIGAELDLPVKVSVGEEQAPLRTHLVVEVTGEGYGLVDPDRQASRIARELEAHAPQE